jgi:hypothetical protein
MALLLLAGAVLLWWVWPREPAALRAARRLLGVARHADAPIIEAAFRARMRAAHPDAGGSVIDAQRLAAARDLLLAAAARPRH